MMVQPKVKQLLTVMMWGCLVLAKDNALSMHLVQQKVDFGQ